MGRKRRKFRVDEEEEEKEERLPSPRHTMSEMSAEVGRAAQSKHRLHLLKRMLRRTRQSTKHLEHIKHFDQSEEVLLGRVSDKMYNDLKDERQFDRYGRRIYKKFDLEAEMERQRRLEEKAQLAALTGDSITTDNQSLATASRALLEDEKEGKRSDAEDVGGAPTVNMSFRKPALQTPLWKIGFKKTYVAPPGFMSEPAPMLKSEGNEIFYSYDGDWEDGRPHGLGTYLFTDGARYEGAFVDGHPHGTGRAVYPNGVVYQGEWRTGRYHGRGKLTCPGGSEYDGMWLDGLRHGHGVWTVPSGLVYTGNFAIGKAHGRGVLSSKLGGYRYEGSFEYGKVQGSGTLFTPNQNRVVRYWPEMTGRSWMREIVHMWRAEQDLNTQLAKEHDQMLFGAIRERKFKEYVRKAKQQVRQERIQRKREAHQEKVKRIAEQREKMKEAKLRALEQGEDVDVAAFAEEMF